MRKFLLWIIAIVLILSSCSGPKEEKLLDPQIDAKIGVELGHYWNMSCVAFSPDGKYVASSAHDRNIIIWDYKTKHQIKNFRSKTKEEGEKNYSSIAYSSDGKQIIAGDWGSVTIVDIEAGSKKTFKVKGYYGKILAVSSDNKLIAVDGNDDVILLLDYASGNVSKTLKGHTSGLKEVIFSADNKMLASASFDSTARIWNVETGEIIKKIDAGNKVNSVAFNKTAEILAISIDKADEIQLFDIKNAKVTNTFKISSEQIAFIEDKLFVKQYSKIKLLNIETGEEIKSMKSYGYKTALSKDGKLAADLSGKGITIVDIESGNEISNFGKDTRFVSKIHVSPSGRFIVTENSHKSGSGGPDILSYSVDTASKFSAYGTSGSGANIMDFNGTQDVIFTEISYGTQNYYDLLTSNPLSKIEKKLTDPVCITSDGSLMIAKDKEKKDTYSIFDPKTGATIKELINSSAYHYFSGITPDDKYFVMLTMDFFKVWELPSGNEVKSYKREEMDNVKFIDKTADGKYIVGRTSTREFTISDIMTGEVLFLAKDIEPKYAALNTDKNTVAVACADWSVKIYDIAKNAQTKTLKGHMAQVVSVCYTPDGKYLLSSAHDNQVKIWDNTTGKELLTIIGLEKLSDYKGETKDFVVFAPNGRYDGTEAGIKQFLYMTKGTERLPVDKYKDKCYTPNLLGRTLGQNFISFVREK